MCNDERGHRDDRVGEPDGGHRGVQRAIGCERADGGVGRAAARSLDRHVDGDARDEQATARRVAVADADQADRDTHQICNLRPELQLHGRREVGESDARQRQGQLHQVYRRRRSRAVGKGAESCSCCCKVGSAARSWRG